jgi:inorganic triphosphatase YgiF
LKLLASAGALSQIREAPIIARYASNAGTARRLEAVYYDTPDRTLFSHGMSLRVRRNGNRYVQTLKRSPVHGQPFARGEWEMSVATVAPDLELLPISAIGAPFDRLSPNALALIFVTKVRRRTMSLDLGDSVVEIAFDEGAIEAGERVEPLTEIELELKAGDPKVVYEVGMELLEIAPLRIGTQSKSDRGYGLAFGVAPKPTKATVPIIIAEHTVDDIAGALLGACQHQLLANQALAECGRDPEGVHQMRVALRRLRTACALLYRELGSPTLRGFSAEAKWLANLLGAARDWDVLATDTLRRPSEAIRSEVDFDGLRQAAEPHRLAAYATLQEALASRRYNRLHLSMRRWIESRGWRNEVDNVSLAVLLEPAPAFSERALTLLHRKAVKRGAHFQGLPPEARHQLRIALKKLRYATEFFQGLYGANAAAKGYLGSLGKLQDALGHENDASMSWPLLCTLARGPVAPEVQRSIGAVMGWQAHERIGYGKTLSKCWRRFKALPEFWS